MSIDSKSPNKIGAGHGKGGMLLQVEAVYNDVKDRFGPTKFMGAYANRGIVGNESVKSMHAYGRAFDIGGSKEVMYKISRYLQKVPGVQYVIYNREISYKGGNFKKYNGKNPHTDHVHVDFLTSFGNYKPGEKVPGTVKAGSIGAVVEKLQEWLGGLKVDGVFGQKTKEAVQEFQKNRGLETDGIVGANTWKALGSEKGVFFYK